MKKFLCLLIASLLLVGMLASCGDDTKTSDETKNPGETVTDIDAPNSTNGETTENNPEQDTPIQSTAGNSDERIDAAFDKVKSVLGKEYYPNKIETDAMLINVTYGLSDDMYDAIRVEVSTDPEVEDVLIGVKAKEGKTDTIITMLSNYLESLKANEKDDEKLNTFAAMQMFLKEDYVFFVGTIGNADVTRTDDTPSEAEKRTNSLIASIDYTFKH